MSEPIMAWAIQTSKLLQCGVGANEAFKSALGVELYPGTMHIPNVDVAIEGQRAGSCLDAMAQLALTEYPEPEEPDP